MLTKLGKLQDLLKELSSVLIAYSGGVDSTFLLKIAKDTLGDNVLAVIAESPTYPADEAAAAKELCEFLGARYRVIQTDEFADPNFVNNPKERCYYCKSELFAKLQEMARGAGFKTVVDGSNFDDQSDYRPGQKAKCELGVRSPLMELEFTKQEIRDYSKVLGLPTWDKPSYACLASRIPYGTKITEDILRRVEAGEKFLQDLGFKQLRVRHHGEIVRIEVGKDAIAKVMQDGVMDKITKRFEELGYTYVTLDLKGYRTGSMNEVLA